MRFIKSEHLVDKISKTSLTYMFQQLGEFIYLSEEGFSKTSKAVTIYKANLYVDKTIFDLKHNWVLTNNLDTCYYYFDILLDDTINFNYNKFINLIAESIIMIYRYSNHNISTIRLLLTLAITFIYNKDNSGDSIEDITIDFYSDLYKSLRGRTSISFNEISFIYSNLKRVFHKDFIFIDE